MYTVPGSKLYPAISRGTLTCLCNTVLLTGEGSLQNGGEVMIKTFSFPSFFLYWLKHEQSIKRERVVYKMAATFSFPSFFDVSESSYSPNNCLFFYNTSRSVLQDLNIRQKFQLRTAYIF